MVVCDPKGRFHVALVLAEIFKLPIFRQTVWNKKKACRHFENLELLARVEQVGAKLVWKTVSNTVYGREKQGVFGEL